MAHRVSELSVQAEGLSCEAATYGAKAVAARGLQKAEEARATAAGAEADALKVGPAVCALADRWGVSTSRGWLSFVSAM